MKLSNAVFVLWILTLTYSYITGEKCLSTKEQKIINGMRSSLKSLEGSLKKKSSACPPGWKHFNAHCYWFSSQTKSWFEAESHCRDKKGYLVKVDDLKENDWLKKRAIERNRNGSWYGAYVFKDGKWRWTIDFSKVVATDWIPGQPSGGEECLVILKDHKYQWNDSSCSSLHYYVCERQSNSKCFS